MEFDAILITLKPHKIIKKFRLMASCAIELAFTINGSNVYVANYPTKAFVRHLTRSESENEWEHQLVTYRFSTSRRCMCVVYQ